MNFSQTGVRTTSCTDLLLCPNITYTFLCEISGNTLRLTSFDRNGTVVDFFHAVSGTDPSSQNEFDFARTNSMAGLAAIAVMNSSIGLSSVRLECRDVTDTNFVSLSTVVKCKFVHFNAFINNVILDDIHVTQSQL